MPKRSSKPEGDANVVGFRVVQLATETHPGEEPGNRAAGAGRGAAVAAGTGAKGRSGSPASDRGSGAIREATDQGKNPAAVALGRLGGLKGGKARAEALTAKKRAEIAKKAAKARWQKK